MTSAKWKLSTMGAGALVAGGLFASANSASAEAGALYRWESQDGTVSFTDDAKRIPERYRGSAQTIDRTVLTDYGRYTPTDRAATDEYSKRLAERLEALRDTNEAADDPTSDVEALAAPVRRAAAPRTREIHRRRKVVNADGSVSYRYFENQTTYDGALPSLPVDPNDPNPVVTERRRVRIEGQPITQTVVVTRQGDRVLSIAKPRSNYHTLDFGTLSDYEIPSEDE